MATMASHLEWGHLSPSGTKDYAAVLDVNDHNQHIALCHAVRYDNEKSEEMRQANTHLSFFKGLQLKH